MQIGDRVEYIGTGYFFDEGPRPYLGTIQKDWAGAGGFDVEFDYDSRFLLPCYVEELKVIDETD